ncbi:MAG: alpha/beta hydrolase [Phycisphaerales bacterium]|nr:alpha/beta hydrolase [Phycisphaerales bacterium]
MEFFRAERSAIAIPWRKRLEARSGGVDLQIAAFEIESACEEAGLDDPPILVGHSMGGMLAAMIACARRMPVSGIVVIDATWPFTASAAKAFQSFIPAFEVDFKSGVRDFFVNRLEHPADDPKINQQVVDDVMTADPAVAMALFRDLATPGRLPKAEEVGVPILGIASALQFLDRDVLLAHAAAAWFAQMPGCGHTIMLQAPDGLNAMLKRFADWVDRS